MITISKSTSEEIKEFNQTEWIEADVKYYGKQNVWVEKDFVFKAEEGGKIVGSISGKFAAGVLYIDDLIVAKNQRGKGIGKMLMKKAEDFGREMNAHKAYLITKKDGNLAVRKFYENLGYAKIGDFKNHYHRFDFVIYEKLI
jgi:ribosomal protein S18 acetylase RimI-like enzyme